MRSDTRPQWLAAAPTWLLQTAVIAACGIVIGFGVWLFSGFIVRLTVVVVPVLLGLLIAAVFQPLVERTRDTRAPEWLVPFLVVLTVLVALAAASWFAGTRVAAQLPQLRDQAAQLREQVSRQTGITLPHIPGGSGSSSQSGGTGSQSSSGGSSSSGVKPALEAVSIGTEVLVGLFLTLALGFLFLKDGPRMWQWVLDRVGAPIRDRVDVGARAGWRTLSTYVRGLTIVALFDATAIGIGLAVLGVPLLITLALLQFLGSYVPTFGALVAGAVAVAVALISGGPVTALLTLVLVVVVQQIGNDVIEPWVMGSTLPIHPAVVLVAVTTGAILWGMAGALLFVPLTAAGSAAAHAVRVHREQGNAEPSAG